MVMASLQKDDKQQHAIPHCLICGKPVPDYEPDYCCSGFECACNGMPIEPCCCSQECERAVFEYIGKPFDERRLLAGIAKYNIGLDPANPGADCTATAEIDANGEIKDVRFG